MNQPPGDDFYNSSTENTPFPPQQRPGQNPGYPPRPQAAPNYPPQGPGPQGFGPPNYPPQGPGQVNQQQGFGPPNYPPPAPNPQGFSPPKYPPPSGPISQPGFSYAGRPQQDQYGSPQPPQPGNNLQSGGPASPWGPKQQPDGFAQQPNAAPWNQQQQPAWQQQQPPANWQNQNQPPERRKRSWVWLVIALTFLALVVVAGGTLVLFSHKNAPSTTPTAQGTTTTNGVTPIVTLPPTATPGNSLHGINTPVQAGSDWIATVTGVKETTSSLFAPNAGNTYLEISLALKNISGKSLTLVSILQFNLTDASGHRTSETASDTNIHRPPDGNVNSNQTLNAQIAFQVPKSQHTFVFTFAYGLSNNNGASISWQITV